MRLLTLLIPICVIATLCISDINVLNAKGYEITDNRNVNENFTIKHKIVKGDVYIECYIPDFNFTQNEKSRKNGEGHLQLYINGSKVDEIYRAAFIVRDLPAGTHKIKLAVVHNDNSPYKGLEKEFEVEIS